MATAPEKLTCCRDEVTVARKELITTFYLPSRYSPATAAAAATAPAPAPSSISALSKSFICSIFHFLRSKIPLTAVVEENAFMNRRP
jgi:hypothetical protein